MIDVCDGHSGRSPEANTDHDLSLSAVTSVCLSIRMMCFSLFPAGPGCYTHLHLCSLHTHRLCLSVDFLRLPFPESPRSVLNFFFLVSQLQASLTMLMQPSKRWKAAWHQTTSAPSDCIYELLPNNGVSGPAVSTASAEDASLSVYVCDRLMTGERGDIVLIDRGWRRSL